MDNTTTRKENAFLIIDAQYDFCHPQGALYVEGAAQDLERLHAVITRNAHAIDHIIVTLDTHPIHDISHPGFWCDATGKPPAPFTQITANDIDEGRWIPQYHPEEARQYVHALEDQGKFLHFIWPEHCLIGTKGSALHDTLSDALRTWARTGKDYAAVAKGTYPLTEHFGIFQAQIPVEDHPETQLNRKLLAELDEYANIYLAGEAKSHCVATSLQQMLDYAPELAKKVIVIEDCMSDVTGLGHLGQPTYAEAQARGLKFVRAADILL